MSITLTYSKTPSGKAKKGQITVRPDSGSIKACFPRNYFNDGRQLKLSTGIADIKGWEATAGKLERRLQLELEEGKLDDGQGNFNIARYQEILEEYGLRAKLRLIKQVVSSDSSQLPPKPQLSILEIWNMYCEFKKHELAVTTYELIYRETYPNFLNSAINAVGEDALKIRDWLLNNRSHVNVKKLLNALSEAYFFAIRQDKYSGKNPFDGLSEGIEDKKRVKEINQDDESGEDDDLLNQGKAFTWGEAEAIMEFLRTASIDRFRHWYHFISFKFLTGCRDGEAMGLWWRDIKWDDEAIVIKRSYSSRIKKFKPTKNETIRRFPMPKDGRLWNLLKELPQGELNECVFKNKSGNTVLKGTVHRIWNDTYTIVNGKTYEYSGCIRLLVEEGAISK